MREKPFETKLLPNTMTYERIRLNWNNSIDVRPELKSEIATLLKNQPSNDFYKRILKMSFSDYITTNYDYAINKAFTELSADNTETSNGTENIYSVRRNKSLKNDKGEEIGKVWNIHGELNHPKTIMLGLNHYCGSIAKINGYLKGAYDFSHKASHGKILTIEEKLKKNSFDGYSWVELFFNTNMHIAGFGLDFSEIDIWWVLTRRARMKKSANVKNVINYYTKPLSQVRDDEKEVEIRKREMLLSLYVNVIEVKIDDGDYGKQWHKILDKIEAS